MDGAFTSWNLAAERLYGYSKSEVLGRFARDLSLPWPADLVGAIIEPMLRGEMPPPMETVQILNDGSHRDVSLAFSPVRDAHHGLTGVSCFGRDITARKQIEQALRVANAKLEAANRQLEILASTDGLTGLCSYRVFLERLEAEVQRATRYRHPLAVLILDVDNFKAYNDTYGHPAGDTALKQVAAVIQSSVRNTDLAARYGGEEFAVILTQTDRAQALIAAERIRCAVACAAWERRPITVSIGVSFLSASAADPEALVARADHALYCSKRHGKNCVTQDQQDEPEMAAMTALRQQTNAGRKFIEQN
jgi:diguanylate cyclase (GGDEF)-like protein/PAS domain S-box-containing protein